MSTNTQYASNAKANTALSLGTVGFGISILDALQNGLLSGIFGGGNNEQAKLMAENTLLKSQQYSDQQTRPIVVEQARQAEQLVGLRNEMMLREQITDGKIANSVLTVNNGMTMLQGALSCLQRTVDGISSTYVPAGKVTPLPQPAPVPPPFWPPFPPVPVVTVTPPATGGATGGTDAANAGS